MTNGAVRKSFLVLVGVVAVGSGALTQPAAATAGQDSLVLVSTPDEPLVGGRTFELDNPEVNSVSPTEFYASFHRVDPTSGTGLLFDPTWVVGINPSAVTAGGTYPLDATSTELRLADDFQWQSTRCPDLTGDVTFGELALGPDGSPESLSAAFTIHCTAGDAVYGSFAYHAAPPALPAGAAEVAAADAAYPKLPPFGPSDPSLAPTMIALRPTQAGADLRWDTPSGFRCAEVFLEDSVTAQSERVYDGQDDTLSLGGLNPERSYGISTSFYPSDGNGECPGSSSDFIPAAQSVYGMTARLAVLPDVRVGDVATIHGTAQLSLPWSDEPEPSSRVEIYSVKRGEDPTLLGVAQSDWRGGFSLDVTATRSMRVMASVRPVRSGSAANIAHFGATTETVRLRVHHQVSADVLDTAVHVGHTATVVAQLKPAESDQPAFLQRRTRSGDWRVVATRATDADGSVRLTLASARKGWQVLRVRVPRDASHSAGTSAQLRVLGY